MHFSSQQRACALHAELQCICRNMCFWERRALFSTGRALRRPGLMDAADEMQKDVVSIMAILLMSTTEFLTDNHGAVFKAASQLQPAAAVALRRGHGGSDAHSTALWCSPASLLLHQGCQLVLGACVSYDVMIYAVDWQPTRRKGWSSVMSPLRAALHVSHARPHWVRPCCAPCLLHLRRMIDLSQAAGAVVLSRTWVLHMPRHPVPEPVPISLSIANDAQTCTCRGGSTEWPAAADTAHEAVLRWLEGRLHIGCHRWASGSSWC